jgi:hypothetical protein
MLPHLDESGRDCIQHLLAQTARHCFSHSFSRAQIESFVGIVARVVGEDVAVYPRTARASFGQLSKLVLELSVDRPPRGIPLYTPLQATVAVDFVLKTYYAQYKLYKATCAAVPVPSPLVQADMGEVEEVFVAPPLSEAVLIQSLERAATAGGGGGGGGGS